MMISCTKNDNKKLYLYFFILGSMMIIHNFVDAAVLSTALRGLTQNLQRVGATLDAREGGKGSQRAQQREKRGPHEKEQKARQRQDDSSSKKMKKDVLQLKSENMKRWAPLLELVEIMTEKGKSDKPADKKIFQETSSTFIEKLEELGAGPNARNGVENLEGAIYHWKEKVGRGEDKALPEVLLLEAKYKLVTLIQAPQQTLIEKKWSKELREKKDKETKKLTSDKEINENAVDEDEVYEIVLPESEEESEPFIEVSKLSQKKVSFPIVPPNTSEQRPNFVDKKSVVIEKMILDDLNYFFKNKQFGRIDSLRTSLDPRLLELVVRAKDIAALENRQESAIEKCYRDFFKYFDTINAKMSTEEIDEVKEHMENSLAELVRLGTLSTTLRY